MFSASFFSGFFFLVKSFTGHLMVQAKSTCHYWSLLAFHYLYPINNQMPKLSLPLCLYPHCYYLNSGPIIIFCNWCTSLLVDLAFLCTRLCTTGRTLWIQILLNQVFFFFNLKHFPIAFRTKTHNSLAHCTSPLWSKPAHSLLPKWYSWGLCTADFLAAI